MFSLLRCLVNRKGVKLAGGVDELATMLRRYLRCSGLGALDVTQIGAITR